jgi:hypothetical protein
MREKASDDRERQIIRSFRDVFVTGKRPGNGALLKGDKVFTNSTDLGRWMNLAARQKQDSSMIRFLRWLNPDASGRRGSIRRPLPGLVAYQWTGSAPRVYHIGNISNTGLYLLTDERPSLGTLILMTLQKTDTDGENPGESVVVQTRVIRWGPDGVGLKFVVMPKLAGIDSGRAEHGNVADLKALKEFLRQA